MELIWRRCLRCCRESKLSFKGRLQQNGGFIDSLQNCIVIVVFLGLGRERLLPLARYTHRSLLQSPAYLAHTSTASPHYNTSRVPKHYRLQSSRITKPPNGNRTIRLLRLLYSFQQLKKNHNEKSIGAPHACRLSPAHMLREG